MIVSGRKKQIKREEREGEDGHLYNSSVNESNQFNKVRPHQRCLIKPDHILEINM